MIKSCANCRNFDLLEQGYDFPNILDTEYCVFRCKVADKQKKESFLMKTASVLVLQKEDPNKVCPFWENWETKEEI